MNDDTGQTPGGAEPTEEELRAAFEEQMRNIRVEDVLLQTAATLVNLAAQRLGLTAEPGQEAPPRDLDQSKLAIDGVRALLPICPEEQSEPIRQALSQLQMAYAREAQGGAAPAAGEPGGAAPGGPPGGAGEPAAEPGEEDRAKARAKIWTPPGSSS